MYYISISIDDNFVNALIVLDDKYISSSEISLSQNPNNDEFEEIFKQLDLFFTTHILIQSETKFIFVVNYPIAEKDSFFHDIYLYIGNLGYYEPYFKEMDNLVIYPNNVIVAEYPINIYEDCTPFFINEHILNTYCKFWLGNNYHKKYNLLIASYIASNKNLYYYLTSTGEVHSSHDIVTFLRHEMKISYVHASTELYGIELLPETCVTDIVDIPLEYALSKKEFEIELNDNFYKKVDVLKFCLLNICKQRKIKLYTCSFVDFNDMCKIIEQYESKFKKDKKNFISKYDRKLINSILNSVDSIEEKAASLIQVINVAREEKKDVSSFLMNLSTSAIFGVIPESKPVYEPIQNIDILIHSYNK